MAITWDIDISNVDVSKKRADITFIRTDSESSLQPEVFSYRKAVIETSAQRAAILNQTWAKHLEEAADQDEIDAFITNLEQAGKANLEAREA